MQTVAGICLLLFIVVSTLVGVRVLMLARRTRGRPELLMGAGMVLIGGVGYPSTILAGFGGTVGAMNVPLGMLPLRADQELPEHLREQKLQDRDQQVITTCGGGGQAALAAKLLKDMGFNNVAMIDGGTTGWKNAGLPLRQA